MTEETEQKEITLEEKAEELLKVQKEENDRREKLLDREEALIKLRQISGMSEAGIKPVPEEEETEEDYADKFSKGLVSPLEI